MKAEKEKDYKKMFIKKEARSGLARFTERPLPDENEVSSFEKTVNREIREDEIEDNLSEIYQDKQGNLVDVTSKSFRKNRSWLLLIFKNLLFLAVLAAGAYLAYYYLSNQYLSVVEAKIEIDAPSNIMAGEEFSYIINYHNPSSVALTNIGLELSLPANFVLSESSPEPDIASFWDLADLNPGQSAQVIVRGKLFNRVNSPNPIKARLSYVPANFSSQFSQEVNANTIINSLGFSLATNYFSSVLVGQESEINFSFYDFKDNYLADLIFKINLPESFSLSAFGLDPAQADSPLIIEELGSTKWRLADLPQEGDRLDFNFKFKVTEKINDQEKVTISLFNQDQTGQESLVWENILDFELRQSDLHLTLEINDDQNNQAVNFSQQLNYSLSYHNRGQAILREVVLLAVIEGNMIDWQSLVDPAGGRLMDSVIVWNKEQISALAELSPGEQGEIDFSLMVKEFKDQEFGQDLKINSWAQFSFGFSDDDLKKSDDRRSNLIEKKINSDLSLTEEIRYFDDNNIPVGTGPLPPEVGEETGVRVYWTINNSLHELKDLKVNLKLPSYVSWSDRLQSNIGQLVYQAESNEIIWTIDRLPLSVYRADAEFNLSLIPTEADRDKILIISPGTTIEAIDVITEGKIDYKISPKTSKLEDDDMVRLFNTGRVQ